MQKNPVRDRVFCFVFMGSAGGGYAATAVAATAAVAAAGGHRAAAAATALKSTAQKGIEDRGKILQSIYIIDGA